MTCVWAIVPARAGSKGVPDKNVRLLGGHPLIGWSVRAALRASRIERVIVSTDSEAYADVARRYGAEAPFRRPAAVASDLSPDLGFMQHAIGWFLDHEGRAPDLWAHLRPTTPLREPSLIDEAVEAIAGAPDATALRSMHEMSESAYKAFELEGGRLKQVGSGSRALDAANAARQSFPRTFYANGYVDIVRTSLVLEEKLVHGDSVYGFVTPAVIEVDTVEDFAHLEFQLTRRPETGAALFD